MTIDRLFTSDVLERLAGLERPLAAINGRDIAERHRILTSRGPAGTANERAILDTWSNYVAVGERCGLLDADVVARLTGDNDNDFRSGLSECAAAWFLSDQLGVEVRPRPDPPTGRGVDLLAVRDQGEVYVEVKAPYVERPPRHWAGDDADRLVHCIREAADQFRPDRANLVFLVPILRAEVFLDRGQLLKAAIGEPVWVVPVALDDSPASPSHIDFRQNGRLARLHHNRQDGSFFTQHTRVSAVISLEHRWRYRDERDELTHSVVVVHNPFATVPIEPAFFGDAPQWVRTGDTMGWNDDYQGP